MIAIKNQDEVEVFANDDGQICIKQYSPNDEDDWIVLWPEHADAIVAAILRTKAEIEAGAPISVQVPE